MLKAHLANIIFIDSFSFHLKVSPGSFQAKTVLLRFRFGARFCCCCKRFAFHDALCHRGKTLRALIHNADLAAIGVECHLREARLQWLDCAQFAAADIAVVCRLVEVARLVSAKGTKDYFSKIFPTKGCLYAYLEV